MHSRRMKSGSASLSKPPQCPMIVSGGSFDMGTRDPLCNSVLGHQKARIVSGKPAEKAFSISAGRAAGVSDLTPAAGALGFVSGSV